jgi:regulator of sigma E protease
MGIIDAGIGGLWNFAFYAVAFLLVLTPVVFIHELGHFLVARWCGVKVKDFSIGFGREIFGFHDRHGTRWRFSWLPLGGYVRFLDDENAASGPSREALERLAPSERAGAFQTKPLAARAAIVAAGPLANFLLAIAIFALMFGFIGEYVTPPRVAAIEPGGAAERAGFRPGDLVVSIDGQKTESFADIQQIVSVNADRELTFEVDRGGRLLELRATPVWGDTTDPFGKKHKQVTLGIHNISLPPRVGALVPDGMAAQAGFRVGDLIVSIDGKPVKSFADMRQMVSASADRELTFEVERDGTILQLKATPVVTGKDKQARMGIQNAPPPQEGEYRRYGPATSVVLAVKRTYNIVTGTIFTLSDILTRRAPADQLRGPVGIAEIAGDVSTLGPAALLRLVAYLSVAIGFINLFPIPMLDGGHLLFYAVEAVRREPLSERTQEIGLRIGLALVLMLIVFVTFNDLRRLTGFG